ncbi:MAG: mannose-1-phosphate guanylyltransferase/mannose-6-phosphate isomerase [Schwartzia sp.]|nr:mannose-1-phosphate guanylyltransferase/mannose-6-phosphate isomerase [Schwartzia sp. (in: firmicutes)]
MKIVILAGGGGTRLFPLSRSCYPKQFLRIGAERSLFGQTVERFLRVASPEDLVVVTQEAYFFHVRAELREAGADAAHVLLEPVGRNTAPAIALAMAYCRERLGAGEDEVVCVSPSDHVIRPAERFAALVGTATARAAEGDIVTLGVAPTAPETGYGYIEAEKDGGAVRRVLRFKEKPTRETAEAYLRAGNYFWNSGMFLFRMGTMQEEFAAFAPELSAVASGSVADAKERFASLPSISIDYAVAERSRKMAVAPLDGISWNDVGSFDAIAEMLADADGNAFSGDVRANDCKNTMILGGDRLVVGMRLSDLLVVDTPDVLLVARKGESQEIRAVVEALKKERRREAEENVTMYRPWGKYTTLAEGDGYKVKRIVINPGQSISLQIHYHRSEHWTVINGTGKLTLGDKEIIFRENESTYIPIGTAHRLENPGKLPLSIIEVQNGKYLEEDDIVRLEDAYGRVAEEMKEDA